MSQDADPAKTRRVMDEVTLPDGRRKVLYVNFRA